MVNQYDRIILGAGLYGLYAALKSAIKGERTLVIDHDPGPFMRATHSNQARVHMGYHYPRSISTAIKSANYFNRFVEDFGFCINDTFTQIYATSSSFSWTSGDEFEKFCKAANIRCERVDPLRFFRSGMCDGAFVTTEYTYDAAMLKSYFLEKLSNYKSVEFRYNERNLKVENAGNRYRFLMEQGFEAETNFVLNATYASINQVLNMLSFPAFRIKYELCEIIVCTVSKYFNNTGLTVMDGPFFSLMPFGKTGFFTLTSVTFTPHMTCKESLPTFACQARTNGKCSPKNLMNCNYCEARPKSAFPYMSALARKYLSENLAFSYNESLFSMKPILLESEIDDSRPTVIKKHSESPQFFSVLSGKINTVYDLDEILEG